MNTFSRSLFLTSSIGLGCSAVFALPSEAQILTNVSQLSPANTVVDFESFDAGNLGSTSLAIGDIIFTSGGGNLLIRDISVFGASGGGLVEGKTLQAGSGNATLTITFANPVAEVGLGWFDANFNGNSFQAFDTLNNLLGSSSPTPLGPAGGSSAGFVGIRQNSDSIQTIVLTAAAGDFYSIDNVSFSNANPIPTPALLPGLLGIGAAALRKRKKEAEA